MYNKCVSFVNIFCTSFLTVCNVCILLVEIGHFSTKKNDQVQRNFLCPLDFCFSKFWFWFNFFKKLMRLHSTTFHFEESPRLGKSRPNGDKSPNLAALLSTVAKFLEWQECCQRVGYIRPNPDDRININRRLNFYDHKTDPDDRIK